MVRDAPSRTSPAEEESEAWRCGERLCDILHKSALTRKDFIRETVVVTEFFVSQASGLIRALYCMQV